MPVDRIVPYDFQVAAMKKAYKLLRQGKRVVVVGPGGCGKTVMIAMAARWAVAKGWRVLILTHRRELVEQSFAHLPRLGVSKTKIGLILSDSPEEYNRPDAPIQIASKHMPGVDDVKDVDLVIVDECHHVVADRYREIVEAHKNTMHLGFTAVPKRLDGRRLDSFYDAMVVAAKPMELIARKLLAKPRIFMAEECFQPNLRGVKKVMGDYVPKQLERRVLKPEIVGEVLANWQRHASFLPGCTIGFAVSIKHSLALTKQFNEAGIPAAHLDSNTPLEERREILSKLRTGELRVVFNMNLFIEGLDLPDCHCVILARPTLSLNYYLQQCARALRPFGDKRPVILDHARCCDSGFGMPHSDRAWSLEEEEEEVEHRVRLKSCVSCGEAIEAQCGDCPECGAEQPPIVEAEPDMGESREGLIPVETQELLVELTKKKVEELRAGYQALAEKTNTADKGWVDRLVAAWLEQRGLTLDMLL